MMRWRVVSNRYLDSVALMRMASQLGAIPGIVNAAVVMATPANMEQLADIGLGILADAAINGDATNAGVTYTPNDIVASVLGDEVACDDAMSLLDELLAAQVVPTVSADNQLDAPRSILQAQQRGCSADLALISVPGPYAAAEAMKALAGGLHVMVFSDNVSVDDEVALKRVGRDRGLLVMGPDCGTAILNGVGLGFANTVRRGDVGLIGASGTGLQEVTSLIHRLGGGVSHAIGTGGRDLRSEVAASTMLHALSLLADDPETKTIVLLGKPPAPEVLHRVVGRARELSTPVIAAFLGSEPAQFAGTNVQFAGTLAEAAHLAAAVPSVTREAPKRSVRPDGALFGAFCGGTFCYEAQLVLRRAGVRVRSNIALPPAAVPSHGPASTEHAEVMTADPSPHLLVDFGDDEHTVGRPHPMIDPSTRDARILSALCDPATAVVLFDVVLGAGASLDPVGALLDARRTLHRDNPDTAHVVEIAHVCGTDLDRPVRSTVVERLRSEGIAVAETNAEAATWAATLLRKEPNR